MKITTYTIQEPRMAGLKLAFLADSHAEKEEKILPAVRSLSPDLILFSGDAFEDLIHDPSAETPRNQSGLSLLRALAKIAPTYYAPGNHDNGGRGSQLRTKKERKEDWLLSEESKEKISATGAVLLDDAFCRIGCKDREFYLGGLTSGVVFAGHKPHLDWLSSMTDGSGLYRILLSHHPEYTAKFSAIPENADLVLSGHAHGGQIELFGRGLYAPLQGVLPKYTKGIHSFGSSRMIVSRGLTNSCRPIPRLFNPCEVVQILFT